MIQTGDAPRDLWAFMLHVYGKRGVPAACLALQETHGLDIPLLLAALYGGVSGRALDRASIAMLDESCASWRETVIRPLRGVRTTMKSHPWMASAQGVPNLRENIKAAELDAEKVQAKMLEGLLAAIPHGTAHCGIETLTGLAGMALDLYDPTRIEQVPPDALLIAIACLPDQSAPA